MTETGAASRASPTGSPTRPIEPLLDHFEEAWQDAPFPSLVEFLHRHATEGAFRHRLLLELVKIDLDHRWCHAWQHERGTVDPPPAEDPLPARPFLEDYAALLPDLGEVPVELLREEYWVRHCWGDAPTHEDYLGRFPGRDEAIRAALTEADSDLAQELGGARSLAATASVREPPPASAGSLTGLLVETGILDADQSKGIGDFPDARALARDLVSRSWLTAYQLNHALRGDRAALRLGNYVLLDRLGAGVTGEVFKARHVGTGGLVALKVIRQDLLASPDAVRRFYHEIHAARRLTHPNVARALDAGPGGARHFLAMEYLDGTDLDQLVKRSGALSPDRASDYIRQAALGLQHVHEAGLVHRDVKPANLLLADGEIVKILDLGLARWQRELDGRACSTLTQEGTVMGTPDYMAPEQAADAHAADIRSDIYSLGCTLYFLLTGQPPFPGGTFIQKIDRHRWEEPPAVETLRRDVPRPLALVLRRMMAKAPEDRFQTPAEVAEVLESGTEIIELPPEARPGMPPTAAARLAAVAVASPVTAPTRRRWKRILTAVLGLAAFGLGLYFLRPPAEPEPAPPESTGEPAFDALAQRGIPEVQRTPALPADVVAILGDQRFREGGVVWAVSFSADSKRVAAGGETPRVRVFNAETGKEELSLPSRRDVYALRHSPDGKLLASAGIGPSVRIWDAAGGHEVGTLTRKPTGIRVLTFTPDSKSLAAIEMDGTVVLWDVAEQKEKAVWSLPGTAYGLAASPDNKLLATGGDNGVVTLWDLHSLKQRTSFRVCPEGTRAVAFAADSKTLAVGGQDGTIRLWDVDDPHEVAVLRGHTTSIRSLAYSPNGRLLASASEGTDRTLILWDTATRQELAPLRPRDEKAYQGVFCVAFSPDSASLASGSPDGTVRVWDVASRKERSASGRCWPVNSLAALPDGRTVAAGSLVGPGRLWDGSTGSESILDEPGRQGAALAVIPAGDRIVLAGTNGLTLWDPTTARLVESLPLAGMPVLTAASVSDNWLATGTGSWRDPTQPGELRLWDLSAQRSRVVADAHTGSVSALAVVPANAKGDGPLLASGGGDGVIKLWDMPAGTERAALRGHTTAVVALAAAPDGRLASSAGDTIRLWDPRTQTALADPLRCRSGRFLSLAWSPGGGFLAASDSTGGLTIWESKHWLRQQSWEMPVAAPALAFTPLGHYLLAGNANGTVYLVRLSDADPAKEKK